MPTRGRRVGRPGSPATPRHRGAGAGRTGSRGGAADPATVYAAVYPGDPAALRKLLRAGADPDACPPGAEDTPLELAAANAECPAVARLLVAAGATVTSRAVCRAAREGAVGTLALLLRAGGDPNGQMPFLKSRTRFAALNLIGGDAKARRRKLELLLAAGADVNRPDGLGMPVAVTMVADMALADRVFPLTGAAARRRILNRAFLPRGTMDNTREHLLHVARLFLGRAGFAHRRGAVAVEDHLAKRPGAQARLKRLLTGARGG